MVVYHKVNPSLVRLIEDLKEMSRTHEVGIWRDIATKLERPGRNWAEVNISRVARFAKQGETIVVPGKLLGSGNITFRVTVAAFTLSAQAKKKIEDAGGKAIYIDELVKVNPKGSGIRIMG